MPTGKLAGSRARHWRLAAALLAVACSPSPPADREPDEGAPAPPPEGPPAAAAVAPIVDARQARLFGAAAGGHWLPADSAVAHLRAGESYRLYTLGGFVGLGTGSAAEPAEEFCDNPTVRVEGAPAGDAAVIGVAGSWDAMPRSPVALEPEGALYRAAVTERLLQQGITEPQVRISRLLRVDLEGDGTDEVLLSANLRRGQGTSALAGDYGMVLLRRLVAGTVQTVPLAEEYYPQGCQVECAPSEFELVAVLDVNGDGVMEVVVARRYFEGERRSVYTLRNGQAREVLAWSCGV